MTRYFAVSNLQALSSSEVHKLYKLRVDIFVHEQKTPYAEIEDVDAAPTTNHLLVWQRPEDAPATLVGCARLIPTTTAEVAESTGSTLELDQTPLSQLGRVAVVEAERGTGLAEEIMRNVLRLAFEQAPENDVILTAQSNLLDFYSEYGFAVCGSEYLDAGVAHTPMILRAAALSEFGA